jgi:hypothetical protein
MKPKKRRQAGPAGSPAVPLAIGWQEYVALVDWDIRRLKAKIDTGARTSAIDVASYELRHDPAEGLIAILQLALDWRHPEQMKTIVAPVLKLVTVANSAGMCEQRPLVETTIRLGKVTKRVRLTVTNRARMRFRMILGRKALEGDFVVDVSQKFLLRKKKLSKPAGPAIGEDRKPGGPGASATGEYRKTSEPGASATGEYRKTSEPGASATGEYRKTGEPGASATGDIQPASEPGPPAPGNSESGESQKAGEGGKPCGS